MAKWRPKRRVRVIAIGLHWRDGRLLAAEVLDDHGRVKGVRPLGGAVEFGESWRTTIVREFREEIGIDVAVRGDPLVMENIYVHEGAPGHEVVFIAEVEFPDGAFAAQDHITFNEDDRAPSFARWFDPDDLGVEGAPGLYPEGLKALLPKLSP